MLELLNCAWAAPTIAALLEPAVAKLSRRARDGLAVTACAAAALSTLTPFFANAQGALRWEWVSLPGLGSVEFGLLLDPLSSTLAAVVAWVSLAVFVYSLGYMRGDPGLTRYWALMLLFVGGMELLVLSENLVLMLVGWEVVGVCSFALISYWYQDREEDRATRWVGEPPEEYPPSHCGVKALLVTRLADALMIAGALALALAAGTLSLAELAERKPDAPGELLLASLLLMYAGALGKSAQLPFMEWLPDAMAGPSSVSALIHAATMVKAGVYLTARLAQLALSWSQFVDPTPFFAVVSACGVATALAASLQAAVSGELKKTLAYSTASQIGYMMAALGAARWAGSAAIAAAVYHLVNHAVFKAALFLAAGVVIHAAGSRFYSGIRGWGRRLKAVALAFPLATASLVGVPPFGGYWSKELVLSVLEAEPAVLALAVAAAFFTAFYGVRMLLLTFTGGSAAEHAHGSSLLEDLPYLTLAAACLALGLLSRPLEAAIAAVFGAELPEARIVSYLSMAAVAAGALSAAIAHFRGSSARWAEPFVKVLRRRLYLNAAYYRIASGVSKLARAVDALEEAYAHALHQTAAALSAESEELAKIQTGIIELRELAWVAGALLLLLLLLASR
jgi:NADH-quinone oxidoreductase subunit L